MTPSVTHKKKNFCRGMQLKWSSKVVVKYHSFEAQNWCLTPNISFTYKVSAVGASDM